MRARMVRYAGAAFLGAVPVQADPDPGLASGSGLQGFVTADRLPVPQDAVLALGHATFAHTCQNCHGGNRATGAPKITSTRAWQARINKGLDVLIDHALTGFVGPKYTQMPARGANPDLTDAEVTAAVLFMVWASDGAAQARGYLEKLK